MPVCKNPQNVFKEKEEMTGVCKYCGQQMMVETEVQEYADKIATDECNCDEGREYRNMEQWKEDAKGNVYALTEGIGDPAIEAMLMFVDAIAAGECKKATVKINERVSIIITLKSDCIDVERSYKEKNKLTAEKM